MITPHQIPKELKAAMQQQSTKSYQLSIALAFKSRINVAQASKKT